MPDSDPPRTPNWADYIDSLHVFNPQWLVRARRASAAKSEYVEAIEGVAPPHPEDRPEHRPASDN